MKKYSNLGFQAVSPYIFFCNKSKNKNINIITKNISIIILKNFICNFRGKKNNSLNLTIKIFLIKVIFSILCPIKPKFNEEKMQHSSHSKGLMTILQILILSLTRMSKTVVL